MKGSCPIRAGARTRPDALALTFAGRRWTYAELDTEVPCAVVAAAGAGVAAADAVPRAAAASVATTAPMPIRASRIRVIETSGISPPAAVPTAAPQGQGEWCVS